MSSNKDDLMAEEGKSDTRIDQDLNPDTAAALRIISGVRGISRPKLINEILDGWAEEKIALAAKLSRVIDLKGR